MDGQAGGGAAGGWLYDPAAAQDAGWDAVERAAHPWAIRFAQPAVRRLAGGQGENRTVAEGFGQCGSGCNRPAWAGNRRGIGAKRYTGIRGLGSVFVLAGGVGLANSPFGVMGRDQTHGAMGGEVMTRLGPRAWAAVVHCLIWGAVAGNVSSAGPPSRLGVSRDLQASFGGRWWSGR